MLSVFGWIKQQQYVGHIGRVKFVNDLVLTSVHKVEHLVVKRHEEKLGHFVNIIWHLNTA